MAKTDVVANFIELRLAQTCSADHCLLIGLKKAKLLEIFVSIVFTMVFDAFELMEFFLQKKIFSIGGIGPEKKCKNR